MGLSSEIDPTKDLPSVDGEDEEVNRREGSLIDLVDKSNGVMTDSSGGVKNGEMAVGVVSKESGPKGLEKMVVGANESGSVVRRKGVEEVGPSRKRGRSPVGEKGLGSSGPCARPKKLVPARRLGLASREEIRKSRQIVYSSSSEDEYEVNPLTGERRQRVGRLFKTAPGSVLTGFLTEDDRWKLEGCDFQRRMKRADRVAGLVCDRGF